MVTAHGARGKKNLLFAVVLLQLEEAIAAEPLVAAAVAYGICFSMVAVADATFSKNLDIRVDVIKLGVGVDTFGDMTVDIAVGVFWRRGDDFPVGVDADVVRIGVGHGLLRVKIVTLRLEKGDWFPFRIIENVVCGVLAIGMVWCVLAIGMVWCVLAIGMMWCVLRIGMVCGVLPI
jgi:hypothetical protein